MRAHRLQLCRGAVACAALVTLSAPVALATPPEEAVPPAAAVETAAPPAAVPPSPAAEPASAPAEAASGEPAPSDAQAAGDAPATEVTPSEVDPGDPVAGDEVARAETPVHEVPPVVTEAPVRSSRRAAQDPPPEQPAEPPAGEPEPQMPPQSDPSCVFPQFHPALAEEPCEVLASDCTVLGTPGPEVLVGSATADLICGLGGDDEIDAGDGDDVVLGGDGNDRITGGSGADCLLGQSGDDEFADAVEANENAGAGVTDVAVQDYQEFPAAPGRPGFRVVSVGRDGMCHELGVAGSQPPPSGGALEETVAAAGVVYELSRLLNEASGEAGAAFPLELPATARAEDGVVRLLLDCERTPVTGTLELFERRGDRRVRAGEAEFECTPPSEVVEVELEDAARERLENRGRLAVIVRVAAEGYAAEHQDRLTIRSEP